MNSEKIVVLWSHSQRKIHKQTVSGMLTTNRQMLGSKTPNDYVAVFMTDSDADALEFVEALKQRRTQNEI